MKPLTGWVGSPGNGPGNLKREVVRVQALLNMVPPSLGGPQTPLKLDDIVGPKTIGAIEGFQTSQFGKKDGRVDPHGQTVKTLARLEGSAECTPMRLVRESAQLAQNWLGAGIAVLNSTLDGQTPKPQEQVPAFARQLMLTLFKVTWGKPAPNEVVVTENALLAPLRVLYGARSGMSLTRYQPLEEIENSLTSPASIPLVTLGSQTGPTMNFSTAFCEPDAVNAVGAELQHRAAAVLLAGIDSVRYADMSNGGVAAGQWQECFSDSRQSADAYRDAATYLFFCQLAARLTALHFIEIAGSKYRPVTRLSPPLKTLS